MLQISLKAARVNSKLTQKETAEILRNRGFNVVRQTLANYEKDSTNMPIGIARELSSIYGIPDEYIFFGKESTLSYTKRIDQKQTA